VKDINKTYRFQIYPNQDQQVLLNKHFGCVRFVYNHFLNERKEQYQDNNKSDNYYDQAKKLTALKKKEETEWLKEVNSQSLQFALRCLDTAYVNFFRGDARFPRFKSKKSKNTCTVPQNGKIIDGKLSIPKFTNDISIRLHQEIKGDIGKMCLIKESSGKYYVSIFTTQDSKDLPKTGKAVGIDLGIKDFLVASDDTRFANHRYTKKYEKKLATAQQHLSRKKKGSHSYEKQRRKVAKIHEKISNCRKDNLHKVSKQLVEDYDVIVCEDLHVKGMIKNRKLSKHIADASWGTFLTYLSYKCDWYGKKMETVDRFYPSSKTCSQCGWINQGLELSDREWTCSNGHTVNRDRNAAINILNEGLKQLSSGTGDHTNGEDVSLGYDSQQTSTKLEAHSVGSAADG